MKKAILSISVIIDILSIFLVFLYLSNAVKIFDKVFYSILILFLIVHINDKIRQYRIKEKLDAYYLNKKRYILYIIIITFILSFNIYLMYSINNGIYYTETFNIVMVLLYLLAIKNYDVDYIYHDREKAFYGNRKIDLTGIKEIELKKQLSYKLGIYYVKRDPVILRAFLKKDMEKIKEFVEEYSNKKRKKK